MTFGRILPAWFFALCENNWPGSWFKHAQWFFAIDETFHIMALGMLIGTLVIVDLRLLGFGMRRQSVAQLARISCAVDAAGSSFDDRYGRSPVHVGGRETQ